MADTPALKSDDQGNGIPCPECGSHHSRVLKTVRERNRIRRTRRCCECALHYRTREIAWPTGLPG